MTQCFAVLGNSGSGKSSLARWLGARLELAVLDLDTVAFEPDRIAEPRPVALARADVRAFCGGHEGWIVEGCYAELIEVALEFAPRLLLLDPGEARCLANCRSRPHEPHKYASRAEQDARLEFLLDWVRAYYHRDGSLSLAGHLACFEAYAGPRERVVTVPDLSPGAPLPAAWRA